MSLLLNLVRGTEIYVDSLRHCNFFLHSVIEQLKQVSFSKYCANDQVHVY